MSYELHGQLIEDSFLVLEDPADPVTIEWSADQARRAAAALDDLPGQDILRDRLRSLLIGPEASPEKLAASRRFRVGRPAGGSGQRWTVEYTDGSDDAGWQPSYSAELLSDTSVVSRWQPSPDGNRLAIQTVEDGRETITPLTVIEVGSGQVMERLERSRYTPVEWCSAGDRFFYVRRGTENGWGVYLHVVGQPDDADSLVYDNGGDPYLRLMPTLWHDRWLVIGTRRGASKRSANLLLPVSPYSPAVAGDPLDITPPNGSPGTVLLGRDGRLLQTAAGASGAGWVLTARDATAAEAGDWTVLVDEVPDSVLQTAMFLPGTDGDDPLVVLRTVDGCSELTVHDAATGALLATAQLPGPGTIASLRPGLRPGIATLAYTDWSMPLSVWQLDLATGALSTTDPAALARQPVAVARYEYSATDGTPVPITVLRPAAAAAGPLPTILTCYGGFGLTMSPGFQPDCLSWILSGGAVAVAAVRGGGERGPHWHQAGRGANKPTAVSDLGDAASWLIENDHTSAGQLALMGGSNGGLMVTAAVVKSPQRYAALAAAGAPLDMIRYPLSGLGPAWAGEYGLPDDPDRVAVLLSYSPYHNVPIANFPPALFSVGAADTRVDPLHSRKMVALLQDRTSGGPVVLEVTSGLGHAGGSATAAERLATRILAFLAHHTGLRLDQDEPRLVR